MGLRICRLEVQITTEDGLYGVRMDFDARLVVIRAGNTSGKSTCLQAIVFALGLEGVLGPSRNIPLTPAVTRAIETEKGEVPVLESHVFLEIANTAGERMTIQRSVRSDRKNELISTWSGPKLSNPPGLYETRDYYVRLEGAATRQHGFHEKLAQFVGWELPLVPRFDGGECPLYLEAIFPLFFVEQKRGWASIQANLPTFLGIREMGKRAIEFVLDLEAYNIEVRRQVLRQQENDLRAKWDGLREEAIALARREGGRVVNLPRRSLAQWPPKELPRIEVARAKDWKELLGSIKEDTEALNVLEKQEIPAVEQVTEEVSNALEAARSELWRKEQFAGELLSSVQSDRAQLEALDVRLKALDEDLKHYRDVQRLRLLGSVANLEVSEGVCPTCSQEISDSLLGLIRSNRPMSVDENIAFIRDQLTTFKRLRTSTRRQLENKEIQLASSRRELDELRGLIRELKRTLISDGRIPSRAAIKQRVSLEDRIERLEGLREDFRVVLDRFGELSEKWKRLLAEKERIPKAGLTDHDRNRLAHLERLLVDQERNYGFRSFNPDLLRVSHETYRPTREGYDIGFEASASDNIRIIWGYLNSLLELNRAEATNHLGLLILDEPKQQDTRLVSFREFFERAAKAGDHGEQIILATSEEEAHIKDIIAKIDCQYLKYDGYIFQKLD